MNLTVEELLAGGSLTHRVVIPEEILRPNGKKEEGPPEKKTVSEEKTVVLRPLTLRDINLILKAAKENDLLLSSLMIKQALIEPALSIEQVSGMHAGVIRFLVERINEISGLATPRSTLRELVQAPMAKACFILAREFGWTPEEVSGMTVGQILLYLEMINERSQ